MNNAKVTSLIARTLKRAGAEVCFGVTGTTNFELCQELTKLGVRFVPARHEGNAVAMADAYARSSGTLGLASVHSGPGLTNGVTSMAEAAKARSPVMILAGEVSVGEVMSNFYIDQPGLAKSVGVPTETVHSAATAEADVLRACRKALAERRTVMLNMPFDVQLSAAPEAEPLPMILPQTPQAVPSDAELDEIAEALASAERPLIVGGYGAVLGKAGENLRRLGEQAGALLATSVRAHGLFHGDRWSLGIMGGFSLPVAKELIRQADVVVGFGVSFTNWTVQWGRLLAPGARVLQVDHDRNKLGQYYPPGGIYLGDAAATADALAQRLHRTAAQPGWRSPAIARQLDEAAALLEAYEDTSDGKVIDPRTLTRGIDRMIPANRNVSLDNGHFVGWPMHHMTVPGSDAWSFHIAFASVGLGVGAAIGTALARPDRPTVLFTGDGGFMMALSDLETAVRLNLSLCIVVYNDSRYSAELHYFTGQECDHSLAEFTDTDFAAVARGIGASAITARSEADLAPLREWVERGCAGVFLVDGKVTPDLPARWFTEMFDELKG